MSLSKTVLKAFSYGFGSQLIIRTLGIGRISILARILNPTQFGLYGIASILLNLLETLTQTGINIFLIQQKDKFEEYINTAWVISIIRGFAISSAIYFGRNYISSFFRTPESVSIIALISFVPLIKGFINPSIVKFRKELEFNKEYKLRTVLFVVESIVAILVSFTLRSSVGIVWGLIAGALVEVVFSFVYISPRPRFNYSSKSARKIINTGKWVNFAQISSYISKEGDDFFVGRLLQASSLGLYQGVYKIAILPLTEIAQVSTSVNLPIFSKLSNDKKRLKNVFHKILFPISSLIVILGIAVYMFSFQIVSLLLGPLWLEAVGVLQILAIYGILKAFINLFKPLLYSLNKQSMVALFSAIEMILLLITIIPFINSYGLMGAAYSSILSAALVLPIIWIYVYRTAFR